MMGLDNFDDNLLTEILIRLPAKTVVGFKVMNKRWYSLISDPLFVNKHTSLQTNLNACSYFSVFLIRGSITQLSSDRSSTGDLLCKTSISLGLPKEFENTYGNIRASCHGLLLVELPNYICIFNPLTKKKQLIPSLPHKRLPCRYGLVFGPTSSSPYYYNHYNVVCLVVGYTNIRFKIFNPKRGCWRDSKKTARMIYGNNGLNYVGICSRPICFRGIIHWLTMQGVIIAFNLAKEESRMFEIPTSISKMVVKASSEWWICTWVGVVEDEINLVVVTPEDEIVIWALHDYENNKWKIKRKDVLSWKPDGSKGFIRPMFFDGERLFLDVTLRCKNAPWTHNWQEYDIGTGVLGPLHPNSPERIYPNISALTEVKPSKLEYLYKIC